MNPSGLPDLSQQLRALRNDQKTKKSTDKFLGSICLGSLLVLIIFLFPLWRLLRLLSIKLSTGRLPGGSVRVQRQGQGRQGPDRQGPDRQGPVLGKSSCIQSESELENCQFVQPGRVEKPDRKEKIKTILSCSYAHM